jgi:hypothetical protein
MSLLRSTKIYQPRLLILLSLKHLSFSFHPGSENRKHVKDSVLFTKLRFRRVSVSICVLCPSVSSDVSVLKRLMTLVVSSCVFRSYNCKLCICEVRSLHIAIIDENIA